MGTLLAIPGNKTLLRRHLSLQFNELVGRHIVQEKRVAETAPEFIPLNPTTKVKVLIIQSIFVTLNTPIACPILICYEKAKKIFLYSIAHYL